MFKRNLDIKIKKKVGGIFTFTDKIRKTKNAI
jgi:hypothetical protein